MRINGMNKTQRLIAWSDVDLLQASSRQISHSLIVTPLFRALFFTVSQTLVFPPSSWQPRNVTTLSCSRVFRDKDFQSANVFQVSTKITFLPFIAMIFWQTMGTLTSPASKKSIRVISFSQSPTPSPMTDGLQFYEGEKKSSVSVWRCRQGRKQHKYSHIKSAASEWKLSTDKSQFMSNEAHNQMLFWKFNSRLDDW